MSTSLNSHVSSPARGATRQTPSSSRRLRWGVGVILAVIAAIAMVLLFLLALATNNQELYEHYYPLLLSINAVVAGVLLFTLVWGAWRLVQRLRMHKFGSRLLIKLAALFCVVGILPGLLIYTISYQFVSRSIENWFDVRVEGALSAGVGLARSTLDAWVVNSTARARYAGGQLAQVNPTALGVALEQVREQLGASNAVLWGSDGNVVASAGASRFELWPQRPPAQAFRTARTEREWAVLEGMEQAEADGSAPVLVQVLVQVGELGLDIGDGRPRFLQVTVPVPQALVSDAFSVQQANREYRERAMGREGLRRMYIGTLTLSLFLAVFGSIVLAVILGNQLLRPILILAEGVREVAAGNLNPKVALPNSDELGGLTRSFALMTHQLASARASERKSLEALDASRAQLQTLLDNLTAGVVVLDREARIVSANPGATRILRAPLAAYQGHTLAEVPELGVFATSVWQRFEAFLSDQSMHGLGHWQHAYELYSAGQDAAPSGTQEYGLTIVARGAILPDGNRLLVFDDISEVVSAQRAQAWGEVARRLAHEIKNPLTPIQLSAERLEMRLTGKLPEREEAILAKSVKTIVDQVDAMKRLVNEFRDYARLPAARLEPLDINELVRDIMHLYDADNASFPIQAQLDAACSPILGDAMQLRQVIHNLLQNAQDASLQAQENRAAGPQPIRISTQWSPQQLRVRLTVEDHGTGFPPHMLQRVFEPYVTTKTKGTGLGLAVVKKIADEHHALIDLSNRQDVSGAVVGAKVSLLFHPASGAQTGQATAHS
ncbi:HAMP domain-containing protein [Corticibacter populi]|uniref:histidine kinase n=1 Tax=Corticibacter populi TaxID=1550736 RepID=A0A3M6QFS9_9BURK|nr:ATP-binding protein [Corticibacter populi]RMX01946.1 HAMP domain-containing protein [Corticibacter populi]RZS29446.1 nitrogen fixation/metabolism regulation signal transduction histidine kinase [Corticibacter populi]